MCQKLTERVPCVELIHPVWPFGRPGSRTSSHAPCVPRTGSVVRTSVIGVRAGSSPLTALFAEGQT